LEADVTVDHLRFAAYGLALGLLIALLLLVFAWWRRRELKLEVRRLREHLNTQMEISYEGNSERKRQLEQLRLENENLRITVKAWQQKPSRHELRSLQVYDMAIHRLLETTPGFSLAWEAALKEAESRLQQSDRGILAFTRRFILAKAERHESPAVEAPRRQDPDK
jgi:hypothetical protein